MKLQIPSIIKCGVSIGLLSCLFSFSAEAKSFRVDQIPNGERFDCAGCHVSQTNRSRNPFGLDVDINLNRNNADWSALYFLDSDADGYSNGRELGDPCGNWGFGRTPERTTDISNPGDPNSIPPGPPGPTCTCGNGVLDPGEECDDGNLMHRDRCSNDCRETNCGNGVVDPGELCDDGNDDNTDSCTTSCITAKCGDGYIRQGQELCDDGNLSNSDACLNSCIPASCGDGYYWPEQEECDQGSNNSDVLADTCRSDCSNPYCGDGVVDSTEVCDDGSNLVRSDETLCTSACSQTVCGNGVLEFAEQCDEGASNSNVTPNACRETCRAPSCGDFVIDDNEECDDGPVGSNQCSSACTLEESPEADGCSCVVSGKADLDLIHGLIVFGLFVFTRRRLK